MEFSFDFLKFQRNLGDFWVGAVTQSIEWKIPKDHLFELIYPKARDDTIITSIRIVCHQVSRDQNDKNYRFNRSTLSFVPFNRLRMVKQTKLEATLHPVVLENHIFRLLLRQKQHTILHAVVKYTWKNLMNKLQLQLKLHQLQSQQIQKQRLSPTVMPYQFE